MRSALVVLLLLTACKKDGDPANGTRTPANDVHCEGGPKPLAYDFRDQAAAERSGCAVTRVYRAVTLDGGQTVDDEAWVFCCPRR